MTDIQYKSPLIDWLTWKIGLFIVIMFAVEFIPRATEHIGFTLGLLSILLLGAPHAFLVAQVILTDEGIKYRRFLRWKEKPWNAVEAVECSSDYPPDVIVLKLKDVPFPANQIWFYPKKRWWFPRTGLKETLPFKLAAKAIRQSDRDCVVERKSELARFHGIYQIVVLFVCVSLGLAGC